MAHLAAGKLTWVIGVLLTRPFLSEAPEKRK